MFSYRKILKNSAGVVLKHKYLWFFGLFATFLNINGHYGMAFGKLEEGFLKSNFFVSFLGILNSGFSLKNVFANFGVAFRADPMTAFSSLVFLLIIFVLFLFFVWMVFVSEIALIKNSALIIKNKKTSIKEGVNAGMAHFWPVVGVNLIGKTFACFLVVFVGLPLFFIGPESSMAISILYFILFIIFLPIALIINFIIKYASAYI
ncbi:hypothetical protein GF382_03820, partial [Candidatus Falkowbacteria bacterium]|nr:hypothetical protein [Candidatus Falkowbacteria bacterium]